MITYVTKRKASPRLTGRHVVKLWLVANAEGEIVHVTLTRLQAMGYARISTRLSIHGKHLRIFSADYGRRSVPLKSNGKMSARTRKILED